MASAPLLSNTIEADDDLPSRTIPSGNIGSSLNASTSQPVQLVPGTQATGSSAEEGGIVRGFKRYNVNGGDWLTLWSVWHSQAVVPPYVACSTLPIPVRSYSRLRIVRSL